jgi:hypothetical protein
VKTKTVFRRAAFAAVLGLMAIGGGNVARGGPVKADGRDSGSVLLNHDGWVAVPFARGYLDNHYCVVADGWDDVAVGFSAKGFTVSDGMPGQEIYWACVPN